MTHTFVFFGGLIVGLVLGLVIGGWWIERTKEW